MSLGKAVGGVSLRAYLSGTSIVPCLEGDVDALGLGFTKNTRSFIQKQVPALDQVLA